MKTEQDLKVCFDLTDWTVFEAAANDLNKLTRLNILYQFLCGYVHSYQDSFNLQQWQTMVHCKLRQLRQAKEDAYKKGDKVLY